jgi:hypothetical protein
MWLDRKLTFKKHTEIKCAAATRAFHLMLEYALSLARDLAHSWPRGLYQYYLCATPLSGYDPYAFNPRTRYLIIYR